MISKYDYSIMVLTYNPVWEKVKFTLDSIMKQTFENFEIIVADDGSRNPIWSELEDYFKNNNFDRYIFVKNSENQGTIRNLLSGLEVSSGKYIRPFGPGDGFYKPDSLQKLYNFTKRTNCHGCSSMMKGYSTSTGKYIESDYTFPFDLKAYRKNDKNRILRNLVVFGDNLCGASITYEREFAKKYWNDMCITSKYMEDLFQVQAALDDDGLLLCDDYIILYENDTGMSTSGNTGFRQLLMKDRDAFYEWLFKTYSDNKYVKIREKLSKIYEIDNPYIRSIRIGFRYPPMFAWLIGHYVQVIMGVYKEK